MRLLRTFSRENVNQLDTQILVNLKSLLGARMRDKIASVFLDGEFTQMTSTVGEREEGLQKAYQTSGVVLL